MDNNEQIESSWFHDFFLEFGIFIFSREIVVVNIQTEQSCFHEFF